MQIKNQSEYIWDKFIFLFKSTLNYTSELNSKISSLFDKHTLKFYLLDNNSVSKIILYTEKIVLSNQQKYLVSI